MKYDYRWTDGTNVDFVNFSFDMENYYKAILQTREACTEAVALYNSIGYRRIDNYSPYDNMELAICFEKVLLK